MSQSTIRSHSMRRATSYDVAKAAGVSQSAVSRCFAPGGSIAPATKARIVQVATDLGYRPNALAQALISKRTRLVAVLISISENPYSEVLNELTSGLSARDTRVLLFSTRSEDDVDEALDQVWRHNVDGVISAARLSDAQIQMFEERRVPLVLYNRISQSGHAASVCCDSAAGERELINRLLAAGHSRFGIVAGPENSDVGEERRRVAVDHLARAGVAEPPVTRGDFSYVAGGEGLRQLMALDRSLDAIVCVNDLLAIGAIDAARHDFGFKVPDDLSIVGFDGAAPARWLSYRVTSIRQPVRRMCEAAVAMLIERVEENAPIETRQFVGEFVPGNSARLNAGPGA